MHALFHKDDDIWVVRQREVGYLFITTIGTKNNFIDDQIAAFFNVVDPHQPIFSPYI